VSAHEWRDAIGDRDRRRPVFDPVWKAVQPNDVGTDEFMTLCRLLGVEPYITVNAGLGDAWSAAEYVEYANGARDTPMGRLRAENGHPEPYRVKYFATSLVSASRTEAVLDPAGLLFKLYRDHFGAIPVAVSGNSPPPAPKYPPGGEEPKVNAGSPTFPLDVAAAWAGDRASLAVAVINPTEAPQRLTLSIAGTDLAGRGTLWRMAPPDLDATIVAGEKPGVEVQEHVLDAVPSSLTLPPWSVSLYDLPAR
jgi:alpha-L-arabinofuranosidase